MIAAVILAAGASERFGAVKQRILLGPVLERVRASSVEACVVVLGAHEVETNARIVHCDTWKQGPGASLRCGLEALPAQAEAAVIVLADGPFISPLAIDRVIEAWRSGAGETVAASYDSERSHPVLLGRSVWDDVPDQGARALDPVLVPCDDLGEPGDVDYPEDLPPGFRAESAEPPASA